MNYDAVLQGNGEMPTGGILHTANKLEEYSTFYVIVEVQEFLISMGFFISLSKRISCLSIN
ncbi:MULTISPECIES: hypothetical protein [unclassified Paenibacillus]|uniref:hypothetical protein n=1 Tax=unclassified Paenibacillus TaxID=185978 RepID=UPI0011B06640|nr:MULTISPECIES: hypothetical protein [unclassified Paenibacillus]